MEVFRHPEWKRLYDALASKLEPEQFYSYEQLNKLCNLDVRTTRGRHQFLRFAHEVLLKLQLHFENVRDKGYRVVQATEHLECSQRQFRMARRRVKKAGAIANNTRLHLLADQERKSLADALCRYSRLDDNMREIDKALQQDIRQLPAALPHRLAAPRKSGKPV